MTYEDRIEQGAAWLDETQPGWERRLDIGQLDLASCERCVLGQVFMDRAKATEMGTGYGWALHVFESVDMSHTRGFSLDEDELREMGIHTGREYAVLTDEWGAFIKDRFDRGVLSDMTG